MNNIHLASIRFDGPERGGIQQWWKDNIPVPLGFTAGGIHCDHVTLAYKPDDKQAQLLEQLEGVEVHFIANGWAADEKGQALEGELDWNKYYQQYGLLQRNWHVTVATNEGVPPVYSNELLERGNVWEIPRHLTPAFSGRIGITYKKGEGTII